MSSNTQEVDVTCPQCACEFTVDVEMEEEAPAPNPDAVDEGPWYKLKQVQEKLGMGRSTLLRKIKERKLRAKKFGENPTGTPWHVSKQAIDEYIKQYG